VLWDTGSASNELWWIDEEGAIFPARDVMTGTESVEDGGSRWRVAGPLPREDGSVDGKLDEQVRVALAELWQSGRELPEEFQYSPTQGLSFVDQRGWRVVVGRGPGMSRRLRVWERLVEHLESQGTTPRFVDVRFPEAPYYVAATD
jgi:hypothetical protein